MLFCASFLHIGLFYSDKHDKDYNKIMTAVSPKIP